MEICLRGVDEATHIAIFAAPRLESNSFFVTAQLHNMLRASRGRVMANKPSSDIVIGLRVATMENNIRTGKWTKSLKLMIV